MTPERRIIIAAVLLAVAQQDAANVRWLGVSPSKVVSISKVIAEESARYVESEGFTEMCEVANVQADMLRAMDPKQALDLYQQITSDNWEETRLAKII